VRTALRESQQHATAATSEVTRLRTEVDSLRALTPDLRSEYDRLRAAAREEREYADTVMTAVTEIEKKIGALTALDELSKSTEERLGALNSLSEHVSLKVKALEGQRGVVERAIVESNRLNEMVWAMDGQIARLADGAKQITKAEDLIERLEKLSADTSAELESGARTKDELSRDIARAQRDSKEFNDFARSYLERIDLARKAADALNQRLASLHTGIGEVETRLDGAAAKERTIAARASASTPRGPHRRPRHAVGRPRPQARGPQGPRQPARQRRRPLEADDGPDGDAGARAPGRRSAAQRVP
jgi:chromosome segregation ATPase